MSFAPGIHCEYCDTPLEIEVAGKQYVFTAHSEEFCRDATRQRVKDLLCAIQGIHENYAHVMEDYRRGIDEMLAKHGIPSLEEQSKQAHAQAMLFRSRDVIDAVMEGI